MQHRKHQYLQKQLHHGITVLAVFATAFVVGACADREGGGRLPTEPGATTPVAHYVTSRSASVVNPQTHALEVVGAESGPGGVSASIVGGSTISDGMEVSFGEPGVANIGGRASWAITDTTRHVQKIVFLYRAGGGPPATMQHYIDGVLVSTTAYSWVKTTTGWVRTRSYMQAVRNGALVGTYTTTTALAMITPGGPAQTVRLERSPGVAPLQRALGAAAYALAFAFAPQDATAQGFYFYACRQEWLRYAAAAAVLSGTAAAIVAAPELTPALLTGFAAALATAAAMEDLLIDCMLAHDSVASGNLSGSAGGGSTAWPTGKWECFEGSYAAHCTTAFTL
ncbi:MAG: hypothetical protein ABI889_13770 [Gemmatimonadota bacterium]